MRKRSAAVVAPKAWIDASSSAWVVGAALGEEVGPERGEKFAKNLVVGAERRLEKRGAGKHDEADAFAGKFFEEGRDEELRAREPVGLDVGREH